jgi:PleD family two-component response regulator
LSMGISLWDPENGGDPQSLLSQADAGLYEAKRKGRNRVEHIEEPVSQVAATRASH